MGEDTKAAVLREIASTGVLRAGINTANFLLVSGIEISGEPRGVAPDLAKAIAKRLGVEVKYVPYLDPASLADAVDDGLWDICLIGAEPARAERIAFTAPYAEIVATYLVRGSSNIREMDDVDQPGVKVSVMGGSAYDLWLTSNLQNATIVRSGSIEGSFQNFKDEGLDVLAGLRPRLISDVQRIPGARILDGKFASVQQAVGTRRTNVAAANFLDKFVDDVRRSDLVTSLMSIHGVVGLAASRSA